jgi:septum site-determining protein MinC
MGFSDAAVVSVRPDSFAIKGALLPMTLLELKICDFAAVEFELTQKVSASPDFFVGSPVVVSVESLVDCSKEFLVPVIGLCRKLGFRLVGLKGDGELSAEIAASMNLASFPSGRVRTSGPQSSETRERENVDAQKEDVAERLASTSAAKSATAKNLGTAKNIAIPSKIISIPIRSGQQIYSAGDLIVLAPVSAGAELLAVGNIHVYAAMRGRALAGVQGDEKSRIFCMSQEAELVSIAGHFMIDENLRLACWKTAAQIYFDGDQLQVEPITSSFS